MAQEMYKNDAMLHLVWTIAQADQTPGNEKSVTKQEDSYLDIIRNHEEIKIDWDDFNAKRKHLRYDREVIIDEACKAIRGCGLEWKIKCLGYMKRMAWVSQEDDLENNMSDKEWSLIKRAQRELGVSDDDFNGAAKGLPMHKKLMTEKEALMHLIWSIATIDKKEGAESNASPEENSYFEKVEKTEKVVMDYDSFNALRKKLNNNRDQIIKEACDSIKSGSKEWKIKCLGYMKRMAWVSQENDLENNISDKEWTLIRRAQKILSISDDERLNSHQGLVK